MTYPILQRELTVHLNNGNWYLRPTEDPAILGPVDFGRHRYQLYPDSFTFGEGLLAGSSIPGTRRLVFCAWSPQWESFYVSSMGGAAYIFHGLGVNYVALRGCAPVPSVLLLNHRQGEIHVRLEPVNAQAIWSGYADPNGELMVGFFALQQALYDRYASEYTPNQLRIFAVGPASLTTKEGAIGSSPIRKGTFTPVEDWAGRGGLGSRLLQYHNVVGCVFGGEWVDPDLRDSKEIDAYFMEHFGKRTVQTDLALTTKYRYASEFNTGGTFGVNMHNMYHRILSINYQSIYASDDERSQQHREFILDHYLEQFNKETIAPKNQNHCGEPCAVVCKKYRDKYKKDYEPYHALGPQVGVFDQRAAEKLNHHADAMGFDVIQLGGMVAWIMELISDGLIPPQDFGFPPAAEMNFRFTTDQMAFNLVEDSQRNADYAIAIIDGILFAPACAIFRSGIRFAAAALDKKYGINSRDRAVYLANGEAGYMVPNQYWVPGMFSPMPLMGKYYVHYEVEYLSPEELGRKNVERMTYELFSDNSGICRFHRKWAEVITDEILVAHYDLEVDYKAHQFALARAIFEQERKKAIPWESDRISDLIVGFLQQMERDGFDHPDLMDWLHRFAEDKATAARAYWECIFDGISQAFADGPEAIADKLSPGQSGELNPAIDLEK